MAKIYRHKFGTPAYPIPIADKLTGEITWLADEENAVTSPQCVTKTKTAYMAASSGRL